MFGIRAACAATLWAALAASAPAQTLTGAPVIIDGDTVHLIAPDGSETAVRLWGIDAPEKGHDGWREARAALALLLASGEPLRPRRRHLLARNARRAGGLGQLADGRRLPGAGHAALLERRLRRRRGGVRAISAGRTRNRLPSVSAATNLAGSAAPSRRPLTPRGGDSVASSAHVLRALPSARPHAPMVAGAAGTFHIAGSAP
jgi:hypothetical protein